MDTLSKGSKAQRKSFLTFDPFGVRQSLMGETPKTALAHF
jgi:hypothetical protein